VASTGNGPRKNVQWLNFSLSDRRTSDSHHAWRLDVSLLNTVSYWLIPGLPGEVKSVHGFFSFWEILIFALKMDNKDFPPKKRAKKKDYNYFIYWIWLSFQWTRQDCLFVYWSLYGSCLFFMKFSLGMGQEWMYIWSFVLGVFFLSSGMKEKWQISCDFFSLPVNSMLLSSFVME